MIYEKEVRMVINQFNIDYYQEKMNRNLKIGEKVMVPVELLPPTSGVYITTCCEYCGESYKMHYRRYLAGMATGKICCKKCKPQKILENCINKYGVRSTLRLPEVHNKMVKNILMKYGSEENYNRMVFEKMSSAIKEKYGVDNVLQDPNIRAKGNITMYNNGNNKVCTSKQQKVICKIFNGILNYPVGPYHLDIFLADKNIGIEYSGGGHNLGVKIGRLSEKQFMGKEKARHNYFKNHNFPIIEFVSKTDILPNEQILIHLFQEAYKRLTHGSLYERVDLDNIPY